MNGGCLCGNVRWHSERGFELTAHCHCSRCRKAHGTAYGTDGVAADAGFRMEGERARFESSPGFVRCSMSLGGF